VTRSRRPGALLDNRPMPERAGLILQHEEASPPALFADWCDRRGIAYGVCRVWEDGLPADVEELPWVCALGSDHSPGEQDAPAWVGEEVAFDPPEVGWQEVETDDPDRVPAGPWLHFHYDQLEVPPGAEELARSAAGPAAFALGPSLGLQFHPEGTAEIADAWALGDEERLLAVGISPSAVAIEGMERGAAAAAAADALFDRWWAGVAG